MDSIYDLSVKIYIYIVIINLMITFCKINLVINNFNQLLEKNKMCVLLDLLDL